MSGCKSRLQADYYGALLSAPYHGSGLSLQHNRLLWQACAPLPCMMTTIAANAVCVHMQMPRDLLLCLPLDLQWDKAAYAQQRRKLLSAIVSSVSGKSQGYLAGHNQP